MVHQDLTYATLMSLKHAVMVYCSQKTQTLYISTPFLPNTRSPTLCQALLSQIISAYLEVESCCNRTSDTSNGGNFIGMKGGTNEADGGGKDDIGHHGGGGPSTSTKRKGKESEPGSSKKLHKGTVSDGNKIPIATLSVKEQLYLSKVS
jgi:hypothetical protein